MAAVSFSLVQSQFRSEEPEPVTGVRARRRPDVLGAARRMLAGEPLPVEPGMPALAAEHLAIATLELCGACRGGVHEHCSDARYSFVVMGGALVGNVVRCTCEGCRGGGT